MKTVLAPNAPWPVVKPVVKRTVKKRTERAKQSQIDANFALWLEREGINLIGKKKIQ